jgi:hypothetical protein
LVAGFFTTGFVVAVGLVLVVLVEVGEGLAEVAFGVGVTGLALADGTIDASELSGNESFTAPVVLGLLKFKTKK